MTSPSWSLRLSFQSTHPLRGATQRVIRSERLPCISIHAPLAGCDGCLCHSSARRLDFNPRTPCGVRQCVQAHRSQAGWISIHAPLAGCDRHALRGIRIRRQFQSTHPLRGATLCGRTFRRAERFQSTHPLRGATRAENLGKAVRVISIHAPLAGCDALLLYCILRPLSFQSTHPLRGATRPRRLLFCGR